MVFRWTDRRDRRQADPERNVASESTAVEITYRDAVMGIAVRSRPGSPAAAKIGTRNRARGGGTTI